MHHLITGGSGFLGNLLARHFYNIGDQVSVLDTWRDLDQPEGIRYFGGSILNRELLRTALQGVDVVHHAAALVPVSKAGKKFQEVNFEGSRIVAEESAAAGIKHFVYLSSSAIFGRPPCPIDNNSPLEPLELYGKSKLAGEIAAREIANRSGVTFIAIRPRTIIGKGRLGIFQILFDWIKNNCNVYVIGSGNHKLQFLHVDDLISAYMLVYKQDKSEAYNVGTDRFGTIREALENLCGFAHSKSRVISLPYSITVNVLKYLDLMKLSPLAPYHYLTYGRPFYYDLQPLLSLGWKPRYSNDEMLQEAYSSFLTDNVDFDKSEGASPHRRRLRAAGLLLLKLLSRNF